VRRLPLVLLAGILLLLLVGCAGTARDSGSVEVPDVHGMSYSDAESRLSELGLRYRENINAEGFGPRSGVSVAQVYRQSPLAGSRVPRGTTVDIWFQIYE
jgi:beta-lactam-binding protein with PASTA domain